jgi:hypothetical protein
MRFVGAALFLAAGFSMAAQPASIAGRVVDQTPASLWRGSMWL